MLFKSNWECFWRHIGCRWNLEDASHGLHSISTMIEMRCRLGGRCKGGSKQQTGLQFLSLAAGRDKGPVEIRTLSLPAGRDKNWSSSVALTTLFTTTAHITPRVHPRHANLRNVEGFSWILDGM